MTWLVPVASAATAANEFRSMRHTGQDGLLAPVLLESIGPMSSDGIGGGLRRQSVILPALLFALATGLCVLLGGHAMADDERMSPNICALMLAVSLTVVLLPGPLLGGWTQLRLWSRLSLAPLRIFDRPPKLATLS